MENQNSAPAPAPDPAPSAGGGGEEGRVKSLDDRFGKIESEQARQGGILERIEQALSGPKAGTPTTAVSSTGSSSGSSSDDSSGLSVAEQVRRGVEKIEADKQRKAKADAATAADAAWRKTVEEKLAERRPAQPQTGRKTRLQRFMFGKADER